MTIPRIQRGSIPLLPLKYNKMEIIKIIISTVVIVSVMVFLLKLVHKICDEIIKKL